MNGRSSAFVGSSAAVTDFFTSSSPFDPIHHLGQVPR
jgi:hypothetical protein